MKESYLTVICALICILVILSGGVGYVFYKYTLIEWWLPVAVALVPAVLTLSLYKSWSQFFGVTNRFIGITCQYVLE